MLMMFGFRRPVAAEALLSVVVLLLAGRGTLEQTVGNGSLTRAPTFSDFFSSVNLLALDENIILTDKLLGRLYVLQNLGDSIETPLDLEDKMKAMEDVFASRQNFDDKDLENGEKSLIDMQGISKDTITARRETLKKYLWEHPFKFIGLFFSDMDVPNPASADLKGKLATDLTTFLGLKLMFKFVLKILGVDSKIGKYILTVSDSMRSIDHLAEPNSELVTPLQWIGLLEAPSSLVTTKESEFGVSEVEAKVTKAIIGLMAAVSETVPYQSPKDKLVDVLQKMKDIATAVKKFLWTLKYETFSEEFKHNKHEQDVNSSNHDGPLFTDPTVLLHGQNGTRQYPEFYAQFLMGKVPPLSRRKSVGMRLEEDLLPVSSGHKYLRKREIPSSIFTGDPLVVESVQNRANNLFDTTWLKQLFQFTKNDTRLTNPNEKWNILRKLFNKKSLDESNHHYYNYFVDESSLGDRIKELTNFFERRENTISLPTDQDALFNAKQAITNLEKLLTDVYGVRRAAMVSDPDGVEDFGNVYYNAETNLDELLNLSRTWDFPANSNKFFPDFSI